MHVGNGVSLGLEREALISKPQANGERQSSHESTPYASRNFGYFMTKSALSPFATMTSLLTGH